jgi:hypothetical protein
MAPNCSDTHIPFNKQTQKKKVAIRTLVEIWVNKNGIKCFAEVIGWYKWCSLFAQRSDDSLVGSVSTDPLPDHVIDE